MYVHGHALFICQLPNCNLFTQHAVYLMGETPLVNCGPRSNSLYWNTIYCNTVLLFSANNHHPHYTSNPLLQQAGEIDNLTVSLGQSTLVVLCRFHVGAGIPGVAPHYIPPPSTFNVLLGSSWFDKPWFLSEGKLAAVRIIPSSWGCPTNVWNTRHQPARTQGRGMQQRVGFRGSGGTWLARPYTGPHTIGSVDGEIARLAPRLRSLMGKATHLCRV